MRRKKILSILLLVLCLMASGVSHAEPSNWAKVFIENSREENLIPAILDQAYQLDIKRYEYVLLALKVLDKNPVEMISADHAFTDIKGHPYEQDIIKAYQAGIIGGYDDGTFRPNQLISRQEVAALVYNLVHQINPKKVLPETRTSFSDDDLISSWAVPFVEFNHQNNIISGVGQVEGLDTIDPLGRTTREQAIVLLNKVAHNDVLLGTFPYDVIEEGHLVWDVKKLNDLAEYVGHETLKLAQVLDDHNGVMISDLSETSFSLSYDDGSRIEVSHIYGKMYLSATFTTLKTQGTKDYLELFRSLFEDEMFERDYPQILKNFEENKDETYAKKLTSGADVQGYVESVDDELVYYLLYKK